MKELLDRLDKLISDGYGLREQLRNYNSQADSAREEGALNKTRWLRSCLNFFGYVSMPKFEEEFKFIAKSLKKSYAENPSFTIAELIGVLQSAKEEIKAGFVFTIKYLLHADFFDSLIDQAEELFHKGHIIPATVLGRIVIEQWLKDEGEKNNIYIADTDKDSVINDRLKNKNIFFR